MSERYQRFTVGHLQQGECANCAWPLDTGDTAVHVQSDQLECEYVACSVACHEREVVSYEQVEINERHNAAGCEV